MKNPGQKRVNYPAEITVYEDRSFTFYLENSPAAVLFEKSSRNRNGFWRTQPQKVATLGRDQIREIAQEKMPDLNAADIDAAMRIIEGTARSMGINVTD